MRNTTIVAGVLLGSMAFACRAMAAEQEILSHFAEETQIVTEAGVLVFRVDLDLNGDGKPELLLGTGRNPQQWIVYSRIDENKYSVLGKIAFSHDGFRMSDDEKRLIVYEPAREDGQDVGSGRLVQYEVGAQGLVRVSQGDNLYAYGKGTAAVWDQFRDWRQKSHVKVLFSECEDLLTWAQEDPSKRPAQQSWKDWESGDAVSVPAVIGVVVVN